MRERLKVHAAKATGVSLCRDVHTMEDAGARETLVFTDFGVVTSQRSNAPALTRSMLTRLAAEEPDVIVLELGDGLMGDDGVDAILESADLRDAFSAVVLAANDPVGVWGGHRLLAESFSLATTVVTGPATDNVAGTDGIARIEVAAFYARTHPAELAAHILKHLRGHTGRRETRRGSNAGATDAAV